ncbi:MAG TPA: AmmeMemoRadiSam system protein A [bacterium]|nr:AmmeMemoRadiSam system protein A [bacterium]
MEKGTKEYLLFLARKSIAKELGIKWKEKENFVAPDDPELKENKGAFVTLTIAGELRGCIGQILPSESIKETVRENAISAAFYDPRFVPLSSKEFEKIKIEISILSKPQQLEYASVTELLNKLEPNVHGLIIKLGGRSATFLPQVWDELPNKEDFLGHLCLKAGLSSDEWKRLKLQILIYAVEHFKE